MTTLITAIFECPICQTRFKIRDAGSWNTLGATRYTDGYLDGQMVWHGSAIIECPECWHLAFRRGFNSIDSMMGRDCEEKYAGLSWSLFSRGHLPWLIQSSEPRIWESDDEERYVRINAWWYYNDDFRAEAGKEFVLTDEQEANLQRLLELMELDNQNDLLMAADIYRALGDFDQCVGLLSRDLDEKLRHPASVIRILAVQGNRKVCALDTPGA